MPRSAKHLRGEVKPSKFKTSMCQYFIKDSECPFGDKCAFAHGDSELRSEQQNITDLGTPSMESSSNAPTQQQAHDVLPYNKPICGEILFPHSNGSSGRDLATPPGVASLSQNDCASTNEHRVRSWIAPQHHPTLEMKFPSLCFNTTPTAPLDAAQAGGR
ncbi:zinc finger protein, putative [Bodo saltans]|uniref:Zinc finger protein, putative n=1 Tax=Bodo saltans TaxID=75058 RepID=A0A0S4IPG1_BODSA|nr:zinc finger protein, putative [Bodo saltans]|eukprot:CUE71018.1 zinc finger protein, putative [Bodo saltans]